MIKINTLIKQLSLATVLSFMSIYSFANSSQCMAKAIYFESRGGSEKDQLAVGHTIQNRVKSGSFPNSVCAVVSQRSQFSPHIRSGTSMSEQKAYANALQYAKKITSGQSKDFTNGATYFHTPAVNPNWSRKFRRVYTNGQHYFYKPK